jgi:hypothetical protein
MFVEPRQEAMGDQRDVRTIGGGKEASGDRISANIGDERRRDLDAVDVTELPGTKTGPTGEMLASSN